MGVSATGQGVHLSAIRNGAVVAVVVLLLFGLPLRTAAGRQLPARRERRVQPAHRRQLPQLRPGVADRDLRRRQLPAALAVLRDRRAQVGEPIDLGWWVGS